MERLGNLSNGTLLSSHYNKTTENSTEYHAKSHTAQKPHEIRLNNRIKLHKLASKIIKTLYIMEKLKPLIRKYQMYKLALLVAIYLLAACSDENNPAPPSPETDTYTLKLKNSEKLEFKEITGKAQAGIATEKSETAYFGHRIERACPQELQFAGDSLTIVKKEGITEKYEFKWQDNELLLHNNLTDTWEYCGKKEDGNKVLLNIGFYIRKNENIPSIVVGQAYKQTSPDQLMENAPDGTSLVWLRMQYTFE